jgi:hypothetical protein
MLSERAGDDGWVNKEEKPEHLPRHLTLSNTGKAEEEKRVSEEKESGFISLSSEIGWHQSTDVPDEVEMQIWAPEQGMVTLEL